MRALLVMPFACACAGPSASSGPPPTAPAASSARATPPAPVVAACQSAEHRQFDFWIGDWDVVVRARSSPTSETWGESKGTQQIEAILGGCAIAESFSAEGPQQPWAGRSYSSWQPKLGKWRQTWVDDSGGYLAFTGGIENGEMTLYGEVRTTEPVFQMRMVFKDVARDTLRWEWQRSTNNWATSIVMMSIDYTRTRSRGPSEAQPAPR